MSKNIAVSNTTPLIHLSKINLLNLLSEAYKNIFIPRSVESEVLKGKDFGYGDVQRIVKMIKGEEIIVLDLTKSQQKKSMTISKIAPLGKGESDAIVLAINKNCDLLVDDIVAVNVARSYNVNTLWTTSLILKLYGEKKMTKKETKRSIKDLVNSGYWLSEDVLIKILDKLE